MDHFQEAGISEQIGTGGEDSGWLMLVPVQSRLCIWYWRTWTDVFQHEVRALTLPTKASKN